MFDVTVTLVGLMSALSQTASVELTDRNIRLHDLTNDAETSNVIVSRIPDSANEIKLDEATAIRLIRNRVPLGEFTLSFDRQIILAAPLSPVRGGVCYAATASIASGETIFDEMVEPVACEARTTPPYVGYNRGRRSPLAKQQIAAGSPLGPIRPASSHLLGKGETVTLLTGGSGVTIARKVTTLQPSSEYRNVFVKTADDEVFSIPTSHLIRENRE